jgi:hypothetical protein
MYGMSKKTKLQTKHHTQPIRFIKLTTTGERGEISTYRVVQGTFQLGLVTQRQTRWSGLRWFAFDSTDQPVGPVAVGFPTRTAAVAELRRHYA